MNHKEKQTVPATNGRWVGKQTPRAIERRGNAWLSGVSDVRGRGLCGRLHMLASFKEITGPCCTGPGHTTQTNPVVEGVRPTGPGWRVGKDKQRSGPGEGFLQSFAESNGCERVCRQGNQNEKSIVDGRPREAEAKLGLWLGEGEASRAWRNRQLPAAHLVQVGTRAVAVCQGLGRALRVSCERGWRNGGVRGCVWRGRVIWLVVICRGGVSE